MDTELIKAVTDFTPKSLNIGGFTSILPYLMWIFLFALVIIIIIRYATHRILVEKLVIVNGGYVISTNRYARAYDKRSKLSYLRPMWGRERLPPFPDNFFIKTSGMPLVGCNRLISLIFVNKNTPVVVQPPNPALNLPPCIDEVDIKRWFFINDRSQFIEKVKKGQLFYTLSILAPGIVIIGCIAFFSFLVLMQMNIINNFGDRLNELIDVLMKNYGG
jgi:hypothetical protein